jgi:hypothetical protein
MITKTFALYGLMLSLTSSAFAQEIPAMTALERIGEMHGKQFLTRIVSMRGTYGQSQPSEWRVVVHDPKASLLLREFWVGDTRATNEGENVDFYPKQSPAGFIPFKNIRLGSVDAFELLHKEARAAKVGFDSVNYYLRCREFSDEPIWTLEAVNDRKQVVGIVDISGETAKVLRKVWIYPNAIGTPADPKIVDTDLMGEMRSEVTIERKIDPLSKVVDPLLEPEAPKTIDPLADPMPPKRELAPIKPIEPVVDGEVPEVIPLPSDVEIVKPRD